MFCVLSDHYPLQLLGAAAEILQVQEQNQQLQAQLSGVQQVLQEKTAKENLMQEQIQQLQAALEEKTAKENLMQEQIQQLQAAMEEVAAKENLEKQSSLNECPQCSVFSVNTVRQSKLKGLMMYYTGFSVTSFETLFSFLIPTPLTNPIHYKEKKKSCNHICLKCQMFLTLCRLRNGFHMKDLANRFGISMQTAGIIFNSWILYMCNKLLYLSLWPHRDVIIDKMPQKYKEQYPNCMAIVDCTEMKIEKPSSVKVHSQCFSEYKSNTTLKALVVTDPRGSLMWVSGLFSGSISDREICLKGHFFEFLKDQIAAGDLAEGDAIMADKGFRIEKDLNEIGIGLNIPPFASSTSQMSQQDVATTKQTDAHRIHVEREINKIKNFKLIGSRKIQLSAMTNIDEIWFVCCYLTAFQDMIVTGA